MNKPILNDPKRNTVLRDCSPDDGLPPPNATAGVRHDEIGYWSEVKLEIVRDYASEYSKILAAQQNPSLDHLYIDAFAGSGLHLSRRTNEYVLGSPANALLIQPPFKEFHFIELDKKKVASLQNISGDRKDVFTYAGDCNSILLREVFPQAQYKHYRRALCLLDPYGLHLDWQVLQTAGEMKSIDIFLNFPVLDMNRNVLWREPDKVSPAQVARMTAFWGDETWRQAAYDTQQNLFGWEEKTSNDAIVRAFRERLKTVAGFKNVPEPIPMRNTSGNTVYYLFFASQKPVAQTIVKHIFTKYANRGI